MLKVRYTFNDGLVKNAIYSSERDLAKNESITIEMLANNKNRKLVKKEIVNRIEL